jgi:hypothetical protein
MFVIALFSSWVRAAYTSPTVVDKQVESLQVHHVARLQP